MKTLTDRDFRPLCRYLAEYIKEELYRGRLKQDIDADLIDDAIEAYIGGAR